MTSQNFFQFLSDDMNLESSSFTEDSFFDFNGASSDGNLPITDHSDDLPASFTEEELWGDLEELPPLEPSTSQSSFFDSFASENTFSSFQSDMSLWTAELTSEETVDNQCDWPSSPPTKESDPPTVDSSVTTPPVSQAIESARVKPSEQPMGAIEALWGPVLSSSPQQSSLTPPNRKEPLPRMKATKVIKQETTPKKKAPKKRTTLVRRSEDRSIKNLYNSTWASLTDEEKGRLLLPLLQGIDSNTSKQITNAGTLLPPPDYEAIGADVQIDFTQSPYLHANTTSSSPSVFTAHNYDSVVAVPEYLPYVSDTTSFDNVNLDAIESFNRDNMGATNATGDFDIDTSSAVGKGLGGPCSNGIIGGAIDMPAPPSVYGSTRQQEALERNAMLRAQGRRR
ncbi:hypothetical protein COCC4DRAFT_25669 [Bipolaris maydis ATCC 48331]|uniref:Uncharacterized protein n=2 Tax=Cochliobolus heterostrophus TaxID=5016 RepID=M2U0L6_COCH5|nr:uncharacterized protein COCC4DRAFT_25669 [Bipolaris maydis ATCC 48331]EMD92094.1 hypothetical protein COCHEDRAFT_1100644 [Bipolaris maydis C5]KAJ5021307.1 hypothetical protein J3E73DRAFT_199415 [Bipolaris maydis]ENI02423.1 hypothetical protein COCC4DRAFT_25669 [Bipolaris maydis ATCC 48331]KAJ6210696.1 hypothetical protein PSV09DRAFT_1100644 [Bipolaris maydis]KAJ6271786.1 hypothetical protein PSV08DRAFT_245951 [Bipolaris maydis]